ncbi:MAG: hypothetical protein CM1200mP2_10200 [Planctomycetaceae bacterium]|nr:MAG: hypothetical protein CM1200mP2_10200 [Planctomycetaceae bacterium]
MVAVLAALRDRMAEADPYLGVGRGKARRELESLPPDARPGPASACCGRWDITT